MKRVRPQSDSQPRDISKLRPESRLRPMGFYRIRPPALLADALSPHRQPLLDAYRIIQALMDRFMVGDSRLAAIALGVPERKKPKPKALQINVPVFATSDSLEEDKTAKNNVRLAMRRELSRPVTKTCLGIVLKFLAGDEEGLSKATKKRLREDLARSINKPYFVIYEPKHAYPEHFYPSWGKAQAPTWHYVYPIVMDGLLMGGLGVDYYALTKPSKEFLLMFVAITQILEGVYRSSYSDIDPPPRKFKLSPEWETSITGKLFTRHYLTNLTVRASRLTSARTAHAHSTDALLLAKQLLVIYCDGNGIKQVNDRLRHDTGNEVIRLLGACISRSVESLRWNTRQCTDGVVVRWGGDEFIVVLALASRSTPEKVAQHFLRIMRRELRDGVDTLVEHIGHHFGEDGKKLLSRVGVSAGYASCQPRDLNKVWRRDTEGAMYIAKGAAEFYRVLNEKGRGQISINIIRTAMLDSEAAERMRANIKAELGG